MQFDAGKDIPDLNGKVILVTGGSSGLGKASIEALARHNPSEIWLAARTRKTCESTIESIQKDVPGANVKLLELDLTSFESVKQAADTFRAQSKRLDILLLNAGVASPPPALTKDGYEIQFGTNHMGHALFTKLLLPVLLQTASEPGADVRVVVVASRAYTFAPKDSMRLEECKTGMPAMMGMVRYGHSKLANIYFMRELAKRYPTLNITAAHPGAVHTGIIRGGEQAHPYLSMAMKPISRLFFNTPETGAKTQLWCCTSKDAKTGTYYEPVAKADTEKPIAKDEKRAAALWEWTEKELSEKGYGGWPEAKS